MGPLRTRTGLWPGSKFRSAIGRVDAVKTRRVAKISAAAAMVLGVGTASALFVDYLADRAVSRSSSVLAVEPLVTEAVAETVSVSPVAEAPASPIPDEPVSPAIQASAQSSTPVAEAAPPKPMPIEAVLPDAAAIAKVAIGPEHAIELATDDAADEPLVSAYSDDSGPDDASGDITAAISPDESEPEPVAKPRKAKAEKAQPAAQSETTEIASLPGVDVGGMAGYKSETDDQSDSKVRTVTKEKAADGGIAAGSTRVRQAVNMRSAPKKGAGVLGVVPAGSAVSVLSCESWCQISYNGRKGWVYKSFIAAGAPAPKKEAVAEPKKPARVPSNRS